MTFSATVTNTGTVLTKVTLKLTLVAPDNTSYVIVKQDMSLNPGKSQSNTGTVKTSTLTSQTGSFTYTATVTAQVGGTLLATSSLPLTVTAVPANGIYASVGGKGPVQAVLGAPAVYRTVIANLGTMSQSVRTNIYLVFPDMTQQTQSIGALTTLNANSNVVTTVTTNPTVFPMTMAMPGNYSILVQAVDGGSNVLASDTFSITRNAVPATTYVPTFMDMAMEAGLTDDRMSMALPAGCAKANPADYMPGGSSVAVADYDGDGFDDIYFLDMMGMGRLYHNNGNGTFTDMASAAGIPMVMNQSAAIWGDIDNDGRPDLLILTNNQEGMNPPVLLHNDGPNASGVVTFSDWTAKSGIAAQVGPTQNLQAGTFGDYDNDGFLDLYIAAHVDCSTANANDHLFHNNGDGSFTDVTSLLGGSTAAAVNGRGLVTAFVDYNNDGREDLYVGNDIGTKYGANVLWRNDGPGTSGWTFTNVSASSGAGVAIANMGIAIGDYNRDGKFDLFLTDGGGNLLLQNQGNGTFKQMQSDSTGAQVARVNVYNHASPSTGLTLGITWGDGVYDFNNDGWEDFFAAAGPIRGNMMYDDNFFLNNQDGTFLDLSPLTEMMPMGGGMMMMDMMPSAVFGDFNNDGFMDIVVAGMMGMPHFWVNSARSNGNPYNWLEVVLKGGCTSAGGCSGLYSNSEGVGARLLASVGGANLWRQVVDGGTYQGNNTFVQHFGLGTAAQVDTLTVYWPSGKVSTLTNVAANQKLTVMEP